MVGGIFSPIRDLGPLVLRLALGAVMLAHGWPKLNPRGPMGGPAGFAGFLRQLGIPSANVFAWVVALLETVGAVLLAAGLGTRLLALGFATDMLVAIVRARRPAGARFVSAQGGGWELEFALGAMALALVCTGGGRFGLDELIGRSRPRRGRRLARRGVR